MPANDEVADAPREVTETPCENVDVPVVEVASMELVNTRSGLIPPANVDVAVVVASSEPTVTCEDVASIDEPLNHRSAEESRVAFVPPFSIGKVPVTSAARSINARVTAPFTAFKNPVSPVPRVSPPPVTFKPPAKVLVAVPVALIEFAWRWSVWIPPAKVEVAVLVDSTVPVWMRRTWKPEESEVEVAVVVETTRCSRRAVDDAMSEYFAFVTGRYRAVEVAATVWPEVVWMVKGFAWVPPPASVPHTKSPAAFVSMESHDVSVFTLRPPVKT